MTLFRKRRKPAPALPAEPPVGVMVQEMYGCGDVYRRTLDGWQMFNRYSKTWHALTLTWAQMHRYQLAGEFVVLDVTAPAVPIPGVEE
jgi:hypothetical protein